MALLESIRYNTAFISGTPASGQIAVWQSAQDIGGSSLLTVTSNGNLGIGTASNGTNGLNIELGSARFSGTVQRGVQVSSVFSSAATSAVRVFESSVSTENASYTTGYLAGFFAEQPSKGAAATITRYMAFGGNQYSSATNNAFLTDNQTFSGDYFIHSSSTRASFFTGIVNASGGVRTKYATDNVSSPPTAAELTTAFGAAATVGSGFLGIVNDNNGGTAEYICWTDGTNWFYIAGVKAL